MTVDESWRMKFLEGVEVEVALEVDAEAGTVDLLGNAAAAALVRWRKDESDGLD